MNAYYYEGTEPTFHPQLGLLQPGVNEIPDDLVDLADACVEAGLLHHVDNMTIQPVMDEQVMPDEQATDNDAHEDAP